MPVAEQGHGRGGPAGPESPDRIIAAAQPSSIIHGLPRAADEECAFSRDEIEVHATYARTGMSRDEGDCMLKWDRNQAYRSRHIRFGSMHALCTAISKLEKYAPGEVKSVNFHEPLARDGEQHVVLYYRRAV